MSTETKTVETKVTQEDVNLDEIFNGAPGADTITLPEEPKKPNVFTGRENIDPSFLNEPTNVADKIEEKEEVKEEEPVAEAEESTEETQPAPTTEETNEAFAAIDAVDGPETIEGEEVFTRSKKVSGISAVFDKLIKDEKIVPFDDDKSMDDYTVKDWEELITANFDDHANKIRRETPQQFFESLPQELQIAARYVADGGQDLKGLFSALATVEETRELDIKNEKDQEKIINQYLSATGYGDANEISEEIEIWKDLGKLETQASKFKPKLDKMQESIVAQRLQEQEHKVEQQQKASQQYMDNVYTTLKDGTLGDLKVDKKVQAMLYNGLVQPNYPSISGKNTNLLGHLLEKYQFVEPNYQLVSEALWLLQDPEGYKHQIMAKGAQESVENTVRKLKTAQSNKTGSSLGVEDEENSRPAKRKLPRQNNNNIFKRF